VVNPLQRPFLSWPGPNRVLPLGVMRAHRVVLLLSLFLILGGAAVDGCGSSTPPALGLEGAGCYSNGSCNSQLVCEDKVCRRPAAGSTAGAGGGMAGAGGDGGAAGADGGAGRDAASDGAAPDAGADGAAGIDGAATEVGHDASATDSGDDGAADGGVDAADGGPALEAGADAELEVGGDGGDL
jgi:hypothetical protein